jgi:hypothetical protein
MPSEALRPGKLRAAIGDEDAPAEQRRHAHQRPGVVARAENHEALRWQQALDVPAAGRLIPMRAFGQRDLNPDRIEAGACEDDRVVRVEDCPGKPRSSASSASSTRKPGDDGELFPFEGCRERVHKRFELGGSGGLEEQIHRATAAQAEGDLGGVVVER